MDQFWIEVLQILEEALPYLTGGGAVFIIQFLKARIENSTPVVSLSRLLRLSPGALITAVVSLVLGLVYALVEYQLGVGNFDIANLSDIFLAIVSAATAYYFKFYKGGEVVVEEEREELEEALD